MNQHVLNTNHFRERMEIEITATLEFVEQNEALLSCREEVVRLLGNLYDRIDLAFQSLEDLVKRHKMTRKQYLQQMQESDLSGLCWKKIKLNYEEKYNRNHETEEFKRFRENIRNHSRRAMEAVE